MAMLEVRNVNVSYGNVQALWDVSLDIEEGKIIALLGANGAGKSTLLNTMTGMLKPQVGTITFKGERIDNLPSDKIIEKGIAYLPEGGRLFPDMTIKENLELGAYPSKLWKTRKPDLERIYKMFPILGERKNQLSRTMSGGERQMLAMGRAMMSNPKMCFFDELSYGLSPVMAQEVFKIVKHLHAEGITVFLVEQNVHQTLEISDYAYVIENGRIVKEGEGHSLLDDDYIKQAYLGI
ncbi:MAG: ABC transporter ATP-binding protein [Clostridiales Family XIII bacterium]|jgi:branched-chain amino acid transport system ATP-binding protein|nr:ABC transporter ATP-binding protein [Clostridiales Family XIII bacterium]